MFFKRRKKLEPAPDPVELDDVELVHENPIISTSWERWEPWGVLKLLHATIDLVVWQQQVTEAGYEFPIHRHAVSTELILVTDGAIKLQRFDDPSQPHVAEKLLVASDARKIHAGGWHRVVVMKPSILTVIHTPKGFEYRASPGDEEIWRPRRIVGRG